MVKFLNMVTMTGADLSVRPYELSSISAKFPFVEWGILVSRRKNSVPRYPSLQWLISLREYYRDVHLSCHVCGEWARDLVSGGSMFLDNMADYLSIFGRIQLNISNLIHTLNPDDLLSILRPYHKRFILQVREIPEHFRSVNWNDISFLFDRSGGRGQLPNEWPAPWGVCGYAGGLNPDNIIEQLGKIDLVRGKRSCCIDAESGVRSSDDQSFDLVKVQMFLERVEPYVIGRDTTDGTQYANDPATANHASGN